MAILYFSEEVTFETYLQISAAESVTTCCVIRIDKKTMLVIMLLEYICTHLDMSRFLDLAVVATSQCGTGQAFAEAVSFVDGTGRELSRPHRILKRNVAQFIRYSGSRSPIVLNRLDVAKSRVAVH
jgi:hypothetical protein